MSTAPSSIATATASQFLPPLDVPSLRHLYEHGEWERLLEAFVEPLHEELYRQQSFDFLESLSQGQQLLLSFDYIRHQVRQGGFIQLIQNNYISLVLPLPEWLQELGAGAMAQTMDDVLKVYVLNMDTLGRETTIEEFARLYDEFGEFDVLETRYNEAYEDTLRRLVAFAMAHLEAFTAAPGDPCPAP